MLHRKPACCRAVQRQLLPSSETIWVPDALLLGAFQRFVALSGSSRRHGSFVPGPLESRRRLGKRRMVHLTEPVPPPVHTIRELWGYFGEADRTQWQWEPPTVRPPKEDPEPVPTLPSWLSEWSAKLQEDASAEAETTNKRSIEDITFDEQDILELQRSTRSARYHQLSENYAKINYRLKQCLTLGVVDETLLYHTLDDITKNIQEVGENLDVITARCLSFYQAVWEGIMACKVLRPVDFQGSLLDRLLGLISDLPMSADVQSLAHSVLTSTSQSQLGEMNSSITRLVTVWSRSWLTTPSLYFSIPTLAAAKATVEDNGHSIMRVRTLIMSVTKGPIAKADLAEVHGNLSGIKSAIILGIEAINSCEVSLLPHKASVTILADSLRNISANQLSNVIQYCSTGVVRILDNTKQGLTDFSYHWLSLVAQLPNADDKLFTRTWRSLDDCMPGDGKWFIPQRFCSDLVLTQWISQGKIPDPVVLRNNFEVLAADDGRQDFGLLLFCLDKHMGRWKGARNLLWILSKLDRFHMVYHTFSRTKALGMTPPVGLLRDALESISKVKPLLALYIYKMYIPTRYSIKTLHITWCPNFVAAMIHDDLIPPATIWKILGIPLYEDIPDHAWPGLSTEPLSPAMANLISQMALAFSRSPSRPQRVSLRNVMQCLHHLRRHKHPLPPAITRAITYAGITREIVRENWIGKQRLQWALSLIEYAEGTEVAESIDKTVYHWRQHVIETQRELKMKKSREGGFKWINLGPVD